MGFNLLEKKGLSKCLIDKDIDPEKFHIHISEIEPGKSSHAQHIHKGIEAIYIFEGDGNMEVESQNYPIAPNETIILDASKLHVFTNTGKKTLRYMVIKVD